MALIRRAAALAVECERLECQLAEGKPVDVDLLGRLTGHLRRIGESIGLDRAQRDVTPTGYSSIEEYARKAAERSERESPC